MATSLLTPAQATRYSESTSEEMPCARSIYAVLEKSAIPLAVLVSLVAFFRYSAYSSRRLWFDEIYTATVALQPKLIDVWNAFSAGVDMQPPLFFYLTRLSWMFFGRNEFALRLPEIVGVILFSWCIFFYIGKRFGLVFGLSGMILALLNDLEFFSGDARPYGMLLAACGLAMLAWRNAVENPKRRLALSLFGASLAVIVGTHAYAITAVGMFAVAELARYLRTKRADWSLWTCFLTAIPALIPYWFPFHAAKTAFANKQAVMGPAKWVRWEYAPLFYRYFFHDRFLVVFMVGMLLLGLAAIRNGGKHRDPGMPAHEIVLAAALAVAPFFCVVLAMLVTNYYLARYAIYAIGGAVVLAIVLIDAVASSRRMAAMLLLLISLVLFGLDQFYVQFSRDVMKKRDVELEVPFAVVPKDAPMVVASGLAMLPTDMYASDADLARTYYLTGREHCIKYTGSTIFEFGRPFTDFHRFRAHLELYDNFVKQHRKFYVYGPYLYQDDWQIRKLIDDGAKVVEKGNYSGESSDNVLLEVELP